MSWRAQKVLPYLAEQFDVTYVTGGDEIPKVKFADVKRVPRSKVMMLAGFGLSRCVDRLFREGKIELAVVYASIGFAIRHTPYISLEGGSVYYQCRLFASRTPWYRRARFIVGLLHYAVPEMLCVRRARRVVAISQSLKQDLIHLHRLSGDSVDVVYNGIGEDYIDIYRQRKPASTLRALYIGRLHQGKGILNVLSEFARRRELDIEFIVAGDGPDRQAIESFVRRDPRIKFIGSIGRARVIEELKAADVFMFPTYHEGFGSALAEAMAAGLTCLTYDIPITREILGDCGVMVPLGDAAAMIERLSELANDGQSRERYGASAHERARHYSWETCARDLESVVLRELGIVKAMERRSA